MMRNADDATKARSEKAQQGRRRAGRPNRSLRGRHGAEYFERSIVSPWSPAPGVFHLATSLPQSVLKGMLIVSGT